MPVMTCSCGCVEGLTTFSQQTTRPSTTTPTPTTTTPEPTTTPPEGVTAFYFQSLPVVMEMTHFKQPVGVTIWSCYKCCAVWERRYDRRTPQSSLGSMEIVDEEASTTTTTQMRPTTSPSIDIGPEVLQIWAVVPTFLLHPSAQSAHQCSECRAKWERV